jgi:DHA3 family macrolide efflux protein-like MFS transporter
MGGGILMASWGGFRNKIYTIITACLIMGAGTAALGIIPNFWIYNAVMAVVGVALPMMNTPSTVLLQQKVEEEYLGWVFGVLNMISSSMMPLGMLVFGPMADYVRIEWMLIGTGILMIAETLFLLGNKVLIEIGKN